MTSQKQLPPTMQAYHEIQAAYDFFNAELFNSELQPCIIALNNKERRCMGYYVKGQLINNAKQQYDYISINPQYFACYTVESIMQALVHEMVHLWQWHFGSPTRKGYHNKEWGNKMESIGLMPSNTGKPGGKKTGQQMMDYTVEGGEFQKACEKLVTEQFKATWYDRHPAPNYGGHEADPKIISDFGIETDPAKPKPGQNKSNRIKYTCPQCKANVWGKPKLNLVCGDCGAPFIAPEVVHADLPHIFIPGNQVKS